MPKPTRSYRFTCRFSAVAETALAALALLLAVSVWVSPAGAQTLPNDPQLASVDNCAVSSNAQRQARPAG